jgi:hypothetical protein
MSKAALGLGGVLLLALAGLWLGPLAEFTLSSKP